MSTVKEGWVGYNKQILNKLFLIFYSFETLILKCQAKDQLSANQPSNEL